MTKATLYGTDLLAWMTGAADREGISKPDTDVLIPRIEGDVELCLASSATIALVCSFLAVEKTMKEAHAAVLATDSRSAHQVFHDEQERFAKPVLDALQALIGAQLALDLNQAGIDRTKYPTVALAQGNIIVGYESEAALLALALATAGFTRSATSL